MDTQANYKMTPEQRAWIQDMPHRNMESLVIGDSSLQSIKTCHRKFLFSAILGWRRKGSEAALVYGSAIHEGLAMLYAWARQNPGIVPGEAEVTMMTQAFERSWHSQGGLDTDQMPAEELALTKGRTLVAGRKNMAAYVEKWGLWLSQVEIIEVEEEFVLPGPYDGTWLTFILDAAYRENGQLKFLDHKTTTAAHRTNGIWNTYWNAFKNSPQMLGYVFGLEERLNEPVYETVIDVIGVKWDSKGPISGVFERDSFIYQPQEIHQWWWDTEFWIRRIQADIFRNGDVPKNACGCQTKFGDCEYSELCLAFPEIQTLDFTKAPKGFEISSRDRENRYDALIKQYKETACDV